MTRKNSPSCGEPEKSCRLVFRQDKTGGKGFRFNAVRDKYNKLCISNFSSIYILDSDFEKRKDDIILEERSFAQIDA